VSSTNGASDWVPGQRVFCEWKIFHFIVQTRQNKASKGEIDLFGSQRTSKLQSKVKIKNF